MMELEPLYQAIFKRKSVRSFQAAPLDDASLRSVMARAKELVPLHPEIRTELRLMRSEDVRGMFKVSAPHFLGIYSEAKQGYLANAGFVLQQMDLYLSSIGIGSCWQGGPKPAREMRAQDGLEFVIMLAFGAPAEALHRREVSEFKRDPLQKITDINGREDVLEPVRIAPSGMNNQPWYFKGSDGTIHAYAHKSMVAGHMNQISTGIALCHLWLAALHQGRKAELMRWERGGHDLPRGYAYIASVRFSA
jgi:nitroreductase